MQSSSRVLRNDLTIPPMMPLQRRLDKFSKNLQRLASLDKLSAPSGNQAFNCFEAISGVYTSLRKLFEHEKKVAMLLIDAKKSHREARAEREVMCHKSGRPAMNARDAVGLRVDYWMQNRFHFSSDATKPAVSDDAMDVDSPPQTDPSPDCPNAKVFSLLIECESSPNELYPPARISNSWISDAIEKPMDTEIDIPPVGSPVAGLDYLDPPPTYMANVPAHNDGGSMELDSSETSKLPDVRFVARLHPPLALPYPIMDNILAAVGGTPDMMPMTLYHHLILDMKNPAPIEAMGMETPLQNTVRTQRLNSDNKAEKIDHVNHLSVKNPVFARKLEEIPFSHPRQIIELLPVRLDLPDCTHRLASIANPKHST
jgi:hypothetical protein